MEMINNFAPAPFTLKKGAPVAFVIALHAVIIYGITASLGYVKIPFVPPNIEVTFDAPPMEVAKEEPLTVDKLLSEQVLEIPAEPVFDIDEAVEPPRVTESMPVNPPTNTNTAQGDMPLSEARLLHSTNPIYPQVSRAQGEQGIAYVRVLLTPLGKIVGVEIATSSGYPRLDEAALKAVRNWRFAPNKYGDTGMTTAVIVPIRFQLNK